MRKFQYQLLISDIDLAIAILLKDMVNGKMLKENQKKMIKLLLILLEKLMVKNLKEIQLKILSLFWEAINDSRF
jgi:hypothetical protein